MNLTDCFGLLRQGYCLWLGAGVAAQLANASGGWVPDWKSLAVLLEEQAGRKPSPGLTIPERLEAVLRVVGRPAFQKALREHTVNVLCRAIIEAADQRKQCLDDTIIPDELRQLVQLGYGANPIVSFNVEQFTSMAIAGPGGWALKAFLPPIPDAVSSIKCSLESPNRGSFQRHIYHPHGLIDQSGLCVITASEYAALGDTLALQLAVHSAFRSHLLVVGMSLDDNYLRVQIGKFRSHIEAILWIRAEEPSLEDTEWAYRYNVSLIRVPSWREFWAEIKINGLCADEVAVARTWLNVVREAKQALHPDQTSRLIRAMGHEPIPDMEQLHRLRGHDDVPAGPVFPAPDDSINAIVGYLEQVFRKRRQGSTFTSNT